MFLPSTRPWNGWRVSFPRIRSVLILWIEPVLYPRDRPRSAAIFPRSWRPGFDKTFARRHVRAIRTTRKDEELSRQCRSGSPNIRSEDESDAKFGLAQNLPGPTPQGEWHVVSDRSLWSVSNLRDCRPTKGRKD